MTIISPRCTTVVVVGWENDGQYEGIVPMEIPLRAVGHRWPPSVTSVSPLESQ